MTTPPQTRAALAEIPDRLEALRVGTTPTLAHHQLIPDDHLDNTTNVALAQEYILSPAPSPDELVIRQRGRRRLTTWSPNKAVSMNTSIISPFQRTPTKMPLPTSMILRSSPRKRLTMGSTPPEPTPLVIPSPIKVSAKQQLWPGTPHLAKKQRLGIDSDVNEERPLAQLNTETPLPLLLQGMSKEQLVELIVGELVADDVKVEERLRARLPMPDVASLQEELLHAKRNIFKSLPTSRLCKKTDSSAYSRAALHLNEFKRLLSTQTKELYDSNHWDALLDYVTVAWSCVRSTPNWDSVSHNTVRRQCFKLLSCHCIAAVKNGGLRLGATRLHALERSLCDWSKDYEDVLCCVNTLNKTLTKGRSSL